MEAADPEVLRTALDWRRVGHSVVLATVAAAWGASPRPPGSLLALCDDGRLAGSVSGGCIEGDLAARLREQPPVRPEVIRYGVSAGEAARVGLPCGGQLHVVLEPLADTGWLERVLQALERRELIVRRLELESGRSTLLPATTTQTFRFDGCLMEKPFGPRWRLLLVGAGHPSRYVAEMALALDYEVIVCDPRQEYAASWTVPGTLLDGRMPDDAARALADDPRAAVLALTHDPRLDDMALMEALGSRAFYVGALGSHRNSARRRERLARLDIRSEDVARLHAPVGLPIGSRTPAEIAVSILAELTAVRRDVHLPETATEVA